MYMCIHSISSSAIKGGDLRLFNNGGGIELKLMRRNYNNSSCNYVNNCRMNRFNFRVNAMSDENHKVYKMNLNEYMVTLDKPLGIRFALSLNGTVFVHSLRKGGNGERSRIIMVGDTLKKATDSSSGQFTEIKDIGDAENMLKEKTGAFSLVLERPFLLFPIHELPITNYHDILFNRGGVAIAAYSKTLMSSNLQGSSESSGNPGFAVFSPKFLSPKAWSILDVQNGNGYTFAKKRSSVSQITQLICVSSEEDSTDVEWGHGSFPLDEYAKAIERSKGELYYNHSSGTHYSKITEQIYVGSCLQNESDVEALAHAGVTAVVNFQSATEAENWGINSNSINDCCQRYDILMINYPIREGNSFDMRKKLPFSVGLLLRLLKKNHRVFVTCTTGFDRSPACVVAYLHWITDTSLNAAYNFVTDLHSCRPDRAAIAWATWDLITMMEHGRHDGPATHSVTFIWNGQEGEDVCLVGDFTGNWKEPIKASHKGGTRYEVDVRLPQGKYYYKYIVNGQWRHSTASPTERDERGNVNNVIVIGDKASVKPSILPQKKDVNIIKVIERQLTENERFILAKGARCIAFSICPIRLAPK